MAGNKRNKEKKLTTVFKNSNFCLELYVTVDAKISCLVNNNFFKPYI